MDIILTKKPQRKVILFHFHISSLEWESIFIALLSFYASMLLSLKITWGMLYAFIYECCRMAKNSRQSKLSEKEDECAFSWRLFTCWDFMIGNPETAFNRFASITMVR
jgi:hypothetical protein